MEAFGLRSCSDLGKVLPDILKRASEPFAALSGEEEVERAEAGAARRRPSGAAGRPPAG